MGLLGFLACRPWVQVAESVMGSFRVILEQAKASSARTAGHQSRTGYEAFKGPTLHLLGSQCGITRSKSPSWMEGPVQLSLVLAVHLHAHQRGVPRLDAVGSGGPAATVTVAHLGILVDSLTSCKKLHTTQSLVALGNPYTLAIDSLHKDHTQYLPDRLAPFSCGLWEWQVLSVRSAPGTSHPSVWSPYSSLG